MSDVRKALALTFMSTNGATAVQFAVTVVLARLLSPEEIGIFSITAVAISVAQLFRDFGVASYLQYEAELTKEKVAAAFGVLLTSSWVIAFLVFLASGPLADFYGEPGIQEVMRVLALGFVFIPFGAVTHNLLTRDYKAKEQAYVRVAGTAAYATTAIVLASLGYGYMSMAWANLINIIATALAYMPFRPAMAAVWPSFRGWRRVVNFGAGSTVGNGLTAFNNALPDIVLGKISGAHDVGLLSRATGVTNLLNQVIGPTVSYAVLPLLSRVHHSGGPLGAHVSKASAYITAIMWPALISTALFAEPLIRFLYGEKWVDAARLAQWLALMLALSTPFTFHGTAYVAIGRPTVSALPTIVSIVARGLSIWFIYDGGLVSFALAMCVAAIGAWPVQLWMQQRFFGLKWSEFFDALLVSLKVSAICMIFAFGLRFTCQGLPDVLQLCAALFVILPVWFVALLKLRHPLVEEFSVLAVRYPVIGRFMMWVVQ
jgi:O-antigen/teichoic acid export membrane protein